ncbi:uncharacterized protein CEXT_531231 [Caerostris extrusa]|uniref:Uncharacterized protein n=1 Tax=Caerostris extrusa TaxID=172846 RepID=A0AAV4NCF7_CAEEX|nr:uncharacterized protein CEXT_531231 [Caerostris extrusa]
MWVEVIASAMFRVWLCLVPVLLTVATGPAAPTASSGAERINITEILNSFFDKGYDKRVRPNMEDSTLNSVQLLLAEAIRLENSRYR